jgi:hypothetical protein
MDDSSPEPAIDPGLPATVVVTTVGPPPAGGPGPMAFTRATGGDPARIVLRQTSPTSFELVEGFTYAGSTGTWRVTPADLPETDLASIPQFMSWFVSRYGSHTLAALLHDHLVRNGPALDEPVSRMQADEVFLDALTDLDVPFLRSRLMWAAVAFATRWESGGWRRLGVGVWAVLAALGVVTLAVGAATMQVALVVPALVAPVPAALLWGWRQRAAGLLGGYTLWLVALPAALNLAVYSLYSVAERALRLVRMRLGRSGPARRQVTPPPSYSAR